MSKSPEFDRLVAVSWISFIGSGLIVVKCIELGFELDIELGILERARAPLA